MTVLYGKDTEASSIVDAARRFPMNSDYQLIIVKEAQEIKNIEDKLLDYINKPVPTTILVIVYKYKKLDKRKSFVKAVQKVGAYFESAKVYENKIPEWISRYLGKKGYKITPKAGLMLAEYLGTDLHRITNELDKLIIGLPKSTQITDTHIEENIGISKEYNIFELQNALGSRDIYKANRIVNYFAANPKENPFVRTISMLYSFFLKLMMFHQLKDRSRNNVASVLSVHPFFVNDYQKAAASYPVAKLRKIVSYMRAYDLQSKGVNNNSVTEGELLKELVYKILH